MSKCPYCHQELEENASFCLFCGEPIPTDLQNMQQNQDSNRPKDRTGGRKQNRLRKKNPWPVLTAVLFLLVAALLIVWLRRRNPEDVQPETVTSETAQSGSGAGQGTTPSAEDTTQETVTLLGAPEAEAAEEAVQEAKESQGNGSEAAPAEEGAGQSTPSTENSTAPENNTSSESVTAPAPVPVAQNDQTFSVGDHFYFGTYEQDTETAGAEPIEWIVIDRENDNALTAISRLCIESGQYHTRNEEVGWSDCTLRTFLNETFYENAFSAEEKALILMTGHQAESNLVTGVKAGGACNDRVYILSAAEAQAYFPTECGRRSTSTSYTLGKGIFKHKTKRTSPWLVRTPGAAASDTVYVATNGDLIMEGSPVTDRDGGIRPVIRINTSQNSDAKTLLIKKTIVDPEDAVYEDWVTFGTYEQDGNTENGAEPIEWIVLGKNDTAVLLISKYILDTQQYQTSNVDTTWEQSNLRNWLNTAFYDTAFTDEEKKRLYSAELKADDNPVYGTDGGNGTADPVFILSLKEADSFFESEVDRIAEATPYAKLKHIFLAPTNSLPTWFTRTPGKNSRKVDYIYSWGEVNYSQEGYDITEPYKGVRPCIMLRLGGA